MNREELARHLDFTLLRPDTTADDVRRLCDDAVRLAVYAVCVPPSRVALAGHHLETSAVKVITVAGFPLGGEDSDTKRYQVEAAIDNGAQEIDVVMNVGWLKDGEDGLVLRELRDIAEAADQRPVKVILETGLLARDEILPACRLAVEAETQFVKTATGLVPRGATVADILLIREAVGPQFGVKAAGGIRDAATAIAMIEAGASRIGTSAASAVLSGLAA
jgi:deoxyribose-phosphate aldolase